ncbi:DNA gyrase subunit B [Planctomyces sp. SH-PL14]|uniref:DNA gyrase subunit B n=1 Tax=Planctomyces sp. SH-PL14 TaxID=1632864 RepID=UPI00078B2938|nr:DNA gyrase subunit B [Planctomyces sp. SH-PL14]AMV17187.1 DNA gyrase subunit B [Planctomyces sp. SH-PL14]
MSDTPETPQSQPEPAKSEAKKGEKKSADYGANTIRHLEGIEGIRHRPAMYIGGTDLVGLHHLLFEVTDNVLDEFVNGFAKTLSVTVNADGSVTIVDDGRGIPVGTMEGKNRSALEVVFTEIHAGGKFDREAYATGTGGLHGVGITAVNACSEWVEVEVRREGHVWTMEFSRGKMTAPLSKLGSTEQTGTKITFKPDPQIFPVTAFVYDTIHKKLQDCAFLNPGIRVFIKDERSGQSDTFYYEDGLREFVRWLNRTETPLFQDVIRITTQVENIGVDIALQWNDGYSETVRCYANGIYNPEGGTHASGFRTGMTRTLNNYGKKEGVYKDFTPAGEDYREGLAAVITVRIPNPQFESQTKIKLTNAEVDGAVNSAVGDGLAKFFEENPAIAKLVAQKGLKAAEAREAAKRARDLARDKSKVSGGGLPEKLRDCRNHDLKVSELYLVEGDSAGGSADTGRDSATQAILPLRGKILNVEKAQLVKVLGNTEVAAIFKAIGIPPTAEETDINKRRYGKIILMTDADVDGSHIRTLLLTFIFRHMRELVKQGAVYVAQPPLYRVLQKNRKNQKPRYVQTHEEMMTELLNLGLEGSKLVIKPRINLLAKRVSSLTERTESREISGADLRQLADLMNTLEEPLESLERRGLNLRSLAMQFATPDGLLPRYRIFLGSEQHWFQTKADVDSFLEEKQKQIGTELKVADAPLVPTGEPAQAEGESAAIAVADFHEMRSINDGIKRLQSEFGLSLNDLLPAAPLNGEPVYPYEVEQDSNPRRLVSLRHLITLLRDMSSKVLTYTRFKGLGEMNPDELYETAMDPETRILKRINLEDAAAAEEIFRVLMGESVEPRREFIEKHALDVKDLDI